MDTHLGPAPSTEDISLVQAVQQQWNSGNQAGALEQLRPAADAEDRPWALALMPWLHMQRGVPAMAEGVPYAKRAAAHGMPWASVNLFNNLIGNAPSYPDLLQPALELLESGWPWGPSGIDPVGQGWNLVANGRPAEGLRLMGLSSSFPATTDQWQELSDAARDRLAEITSSADTSRQLRAQVEEVARTSSEAIVKAHRDLETSAHQAGLLVTAVVSESSASLLKADAEANERQSKSAWNWGIGVLSVAAATAVTPLFMHYLGVGPDYSAPALLGAHAGSTGALGAVAGVLLARSRSRDLARQRANDLSTAMGTMINYSNQIQNPDEKQRFLMTMGQLVLQAHLTTGGSGRGGDESVSGLVALANLVRPPGQTSASG